MTGVYPLSFAAGVLSFLSPCILPMIAVYFTVITGLSMDDLRRADLLGLRRHVIINTVAFVLAFSAVFILAGAAAARAGAFLGGYLNYLNLFGGILVILFGLRLMGLVPIRLFERLDLSRYLDAGRVAARAGGRGWPQGLVAFLVGIVFAVACSHCIGYTLYSILIYAGASRSVAQGAAMMAFYSAGLAIPYILVGLSVSQATTILKKMKPYQPRVAFVSGLLMVVFGSLAAAGKFTVLTQFFSNLLPWKLPLGM